ncbi:MAG: glycosyltransferase family 4 protein [Candidatus Solibacter usitatus]|nr:glycosyltransferase family 4 protein [Candidatus Solibacter usitatus]
MALLEGDLFKPFVRECNDISAVERLFANEPFRSAFLHEHGFVPPLARFVPPTGEIVPRYEVLPSLSDGYGLTALAKALSAGDPVGADSLLSRFQSNYIAVQHAKHHVAKRRLRRFTAPTVRAFRSLRGESSRKTVLFLTGPSAFSGGEAMLCILCEHLDRERYHRVAVVGMEGHLAQRLRRCCADVIIPESEFATATSSNISMFLDLFERTNVDILHLNHFDCPSAIAAARLAGIPVVVHVRTFAAPDAVQVIREADRVLVVSDAVRRHLIRLGVPEGLVRVVYDGVEWPVEPISAESRGSLSRVLMIAALWPPKRHDLLIAAAPIILHEYPNTRFTIIGEPVDPVYVDGLQQMVRDLDLGDHVEFLGFRTDVDAIQRNSNLLVLCSDREPLSLAVIQSLAIGLPVVSVNSGGMSEIIRNEETGLLVDERRPEALAHAILRLLSSPALRAKVSHNGRAEIANKFAVAGHVEAVIRVYSELLREEEVIASYFPAQNSCLG